jgi:hypothetical protein
MADGNQFLIQCQTLVRAMDSQGPADFDTGHCMGVVQAVTDMLALYQDQLPKKFCVPSTVTYGQGARIVAKYLQENPKFLNNQDTVLVLAAYANAYGCK